MFLLSDSPENAETIPSVRVCKIDYALQFWFPCSSINFNVKIALLQGGSGF